MSGMQKRGGFSPCPTFRSSCCARAQSSLCAALHLLPTGLSFALPEGTFGAVVARSGLASKQGLRPANCLGVIDSDYRGECFVALHNDSSEERTVRHGDRVAQLVLLPFLPMEFEEVDELPATVRGEGGFGSTGR